MVADARLRLGDARLMLLFTPSVCPLERDPLDVLASLLGSVDVVQVRVKAASGPSSARDVHAWAERVLALVKESAAQPLVFVNDRVDVALALRDEGVAGVHLGTDDMDPRKAREVLGDEALIGLSTHTATQIAAAQDLPVDYLGFGPVFPTATKGYERGLGPEAAWIAAQASGVPVFPIGGIALDNVAQLAEVGRAAVASALLSADDPAGVAHGLREALQA